MPTNDLGSRIGHGSIVRLYSGAAVGVCRGTNFSGQGWQEMEAAAAQTCYIWEFIWFHSRYVQDNGPNGSYGTL